MVSIFVSFCSVNLFCVLLRMLSGLTRKNTVMAIQNFRSCLRLDTKTNFYVMSFRKEGSSRILKASKWSIFPDRARIPESDRDLHRGFPQKILKIRD